MPTTPHPLEAKEPVASGEDRFGCGKSPVRPAGISLPGVTGPEVTGLIAPNGRWRTRLRERLVVIETSKSLAPYLARAEERADAAIGEIQQTAGYCGPIAETQAVLGARFAELALYIIDHARELDTKQGRNDILLARACADTSRLNLENALKTAHAIANAKPASTVDPLAGFLAAPQDGDDTEEPGET